MEHLEAATTGQVNSSAAEVYESFFVPALFGQWPDRLLDVAKLSPTDSVLDVGCGTGVLSRAAARRVDPAGTVTGVDINGGMLAVARRSDASVKWEEGAAENLPFPNDSFDRTLSQFALMFFADQQLAIDEMKRVTRPGGTITLATWASVAQSPGYAAMVALLQRLFGGEAATALMAPFTLGTEAELRAVIDAPLPGAVITQHDGEARFDSIEAWVRTDVRGWTLADMIDDDQYQELLRAAAVDLAGFVDTDGQVRFPAPALFVAALV